MRSISILLTFFLVLPVQAHEYWIEPKSYAVQEGQNVTAGLFNGQRFAGGEFTFLPRDFRRFDLASGERVEPVKGRMGDRPALNMAPLGEGLHVALYESAGDIVTYKDFSQFTRFAAHKDFLPALEQHVARGLPTKDFKEFYTRHAKSLIAVGNGQGGDRAYGLETEIVALKNPYTDDVSSGLPVRVLYQSVPRKKAQIELFDKDSSGKVVVSYVWTDANGEALLSVTPGHSYLIDAVVLREPASGSPAEAKGAVWETLWAALTFGVAE